MGRRVTTKGDGWSVTLDIEAFERLRKEPLVEADLLARGEAIARGCGEGYVARPAPSKRRARVVVNADTPEAMNHEAQHNELIRHLDDGR